MGCHEDAMTAAAKKNAKKRQNKKDKKLQLEAPKVVLSETELASLAKQAPLAKQFASCAAAVQQKSGLEDDEMAKVLRMSLQEDQQRKKQQESEEEMLKEALEASRAKIQKLPRIQN